MKRLIICGVLVATGCMSTRWSIPQDAPVADVATIAAMRGEELTTRRVFVNDGYTLPYRLHAPAKYEENTRYPLVLFLHGAGERGTDNYGCAAYTYAVADKERKNPLIGTFISIGMAKREGWFDKPGSKWQTMPEQMLQYRAAAFWQRTNCPEVSMGFLTQEEAEDIRDIEFEPVAEPTPPPTAQIAQEAATPATEPQTATPATETKKAPF